MTFKPECSTSCPMHNECTGDFAHLSKEGIVFFRGQQCETVLGRIVTFFFKSKGGNTIEKKAKKCPMKDTRLFILE